jgi:hypothetical protein
VKVGQLRGHDFSFADLEREVFGVWAGDGRFDREGLDGNYLMSAGCSDRGVAVGAVHYRNVEFRPSDLNELFYRVFLAEPIPPKLG